jgi:integrase
MNEIGSSFSEWSQQISSKLPPLPRIIRYYDNYSNSYSELRDFASNDIWTIHYDGRTSNLDFGSFPASLLPLLKSWCAATLPLYSPQSVHFYLNALRLEFTSMLSNVIISGPFELQSSWFALLGNKATTGLLTALSNILHFLCEHSVPPWTPEWDDLITLQPYPKHDKYASVRIGDVFISLEEEQTYVTYLDNVVRYIREQPDFLHRRDIRDACILLISYAFGMRPKQIAMVRLQDVRIWGDDHGRTPNVHITFVTIKQRVSAKVVPLRRRVKPDWAPIFAEYTRHLIDAGRKSTSHYFGLTPNEVAQAIIRITSKLGTPRSSNELRHSFAQRTVDSGATEEELAEALGHSNLDTGLVYFTYSKTMAQRVNKALGVSQIYNAVLRFAHQPFISPEELSRLKGELQIGGTPHGIPIAGIGGCKSGQPNCPYNPVLSCYGCEQFMPIKERQIHVRVLKDLKELLIFVLSSSYADAGSPAFQLRRTISNIQSLISELSDGLNEPESD